MSKRRYKFVVDVPKTDASAYNPNRPASDLIKQQLKHLHAVEQTLPAEARTGIDIETLGTEHHASSYIAHVMTRIVQHATQSDRRPHGVKAAATRTMARVPKKSSVKAPMKKVPAKKRASTKQDVRPSGRPRR